MPQWWRRNLDADLATTPACVPDRMGDSYRATMQCVPGYVRVENISRSSVVSERCRVASTMGERMVGLLRSPEPLPGEGLMIERTQSIHMWFMPYAIDVIFFDEQKRVTKTIARLRPWRLVPWAPGARDCLELRVGSIEGSGTRVGDELRISPAG